MAFKHVRSNGSTTLTGHSRHTLLLRRPQAVRLGARACVQPEGALIRFCDSPTVLRLCQGTPDRLCLCTGRRLYASERERMYGQKKRRTERLAARAARRSRTLALAYSASVAASYLILVFNAAAALPHS